MSSLNKIAHVCLVSDQPLPNILPTLIDEIKPEICLLIVTERMKVKAHFLAAGLKRLGVNSEIVAIANEILDSVDNLSQTFETAIHQLQGNYRILFNATGGTKILSIASFLAGFNANLEVFYYENNRIIWLNSIGHHQSLSLKKSLKFEIFLKIHGIEITKEDNKKIPKRLSQLMEKWVSRVGEGEILGRLNYLAMKAVNKPPFAAKLSKEESQDGKLKKYLNELVELDIINISKEFDSIEFKTLENKYFINGGWLEELVFDTLKSLQRTHKEITYVARNVIVNYQYDSLNIEKTHDITKNELDVMAIINNQLWVFEVKTKDMKQSSPNTAENPTQAMLYKLAGIIYHLGGNNTKGVVVSYRKIGLYDKERAKILKLNVVEGKDLLGLKKILKTQIGLS